MFIVTKHHKCHSLSSAQDCKIPGFFFKKTQIGDMQHSKAHGNYTILNPFGSTVALLNTKVSVTTKGLTLQTSDDSIYQKQRYIIFDIDITYCIVSLKLEFFNIFEYFSYIVTFFIYYGISSQAFIVFTVFVMLMIFYSE